MAGNTEDTEISIRVDRWLWFARFFKSRSIATKLVQSKKVRVNSTLIAKPSVTIRLGDVLTFPQAKDIRVIKVVKLGERRGPAPEAQLLYEDLAPKEEKAKKPEGPDISSSPSREKGAGRPTKADRRAIDEFRHKADH